MKIPTFLLAVLLVLALAAVLSVLPAHAQEQAAPHPRQDVVVDQDLRNGLGSLLQFIGHAFEIGDGHRARVYLDAVARDIITGRGHPGPVPGPVTPPRGALLGASQECTARPAAEPITFVGVGDGFTDSIKDAAGDIIGSVKSYVVTFAFYDHRSGSYVEIGKYASWDNAVQAARNYFAADHCG